MRLYRNLCIAVVQCLHSIFEEKKYADKVIEKVLKQNPKWGARDRRFIAETTYDIVRWYRFLSEVSEARENDFWKLLGTWLIWRKINIPDWEEFNEVDSSAIEKSIGEKRSIKIEESVPDWMDELGESELGERWSKELQALNGEASVFVRANTHKTTADNLVELLRLEGIETEIHKDVQNAIELKQRQNIFRTQAFKSGLFEVQDAGSQQVAPFLQIEPGMRVIDACAGAGGKTLHLAALLKNKGKVIALDTEEWKLKELKKRARRAGATNIETRTIESSKTIKRLINSAERLLLDVPCSGLGVLKRNPDAKWKLSLDFINKVKGLQQKILKEYSCMLKPGGMMVYSTCSILPSENQEQVKNFIATASEFELIKEKHIWPSDGFDGFYIALIKKK